MKRFVLLALTGGIVIGCYSTLSSFDKRVAKLGCINARECYAADFEAEYDSLDECVDDLKAQLDVTFNGCTYDPARGRSCIHAMYKLRKECDLFGMDMLSECSGAVTCTLPVSDDGSLAHQILRSFVTPGVGAADSVPLDSAELDTTELDPAMNNAIDALE